MELNHQKLWDKCLENFTSLLDKHTMEKWVLPIKLVSLEQIVENGIELSHLMVEAPSEEFIDFIISNLQEKFTIVLDAVFTKGRYKLDFIFPSHNEETEKAPTPNDAYQNLFNKQLNFENFIQGESNRLALSLAYSVAIKPGQSPQNLLFIYGPSGVGKTHLCQAIGQKVMEIHPSKRVYYVSSSKFEAQYTTAAMSSNRAKFIAAYQQVDVLVIDDIQGLVGKTATQQAFFEIFNHLVDLNKQIVLTCDLPIVELNGMQERIQTRIQSSVMIPLERPDLELRRKILRNRMLKAGLNLGEEVVELIAETAYRNVRELDGTFNTLHAIQNTTHQNIDIDTTRNVLLSSMPIEKKEINIKLIHEIVTDSFGIGYDEVYKKSRKAHLVQCRQMIMYLANELTSTSLTAIASYLNLKTHSNILHGCKAIKDLIDTNDNVRNLYLQIKEKLS